MTNQLDLLEQLINEQSILSCAIKRSQDAVERLRLSILESKHD